jgi:hypothetical protein
LTEVTSAASKRLWQHRFDTLQRVKGDLSRVCENAVKKQWTFTELLNAAQEVYSDRRYKQLPLYLRSEVKGFEEGLFKGRYSPFAYYGPNVLVKMFHLYEGALYDGYDHWRKTFPEADAAGLTDSVVQVWTNTGKVYYAGDRKDVEGQTFPFAR